MSLVRNLTPHAITVALPNGGTLVVPASGAVARVGGCRWDEGVLQHEGELLPICGLVLGEVTGLPDPVPGTWYVVSRMVAASSPRRSDLLVPDNFVRDASGLTAAARAFGRFDGPRPLGGCVADLEWRAAELFSVLEDSEQDVAAGARQRFDAHAAAVREAAGELESAVIDALIKRLARSSGTSDEAVVKELTWSPAFRAARALLRGATCQHPLFLRWLCTVRGSSTVYEHIASGRHPLRYEDDRLFLAGLSLEETA